MLSDKVKLILNQEKQRYFRHMKIEKKAIILIIITFAFALLGICALCFTSLPLKFGFIDVIIKLLAITIATKTIASLKPFRNILLEVKRTLNLHPRKELDKLQAEEVEIRQRQKEKAQPSESFSTHQEILELKHLKDTLLIQPTIEKDKVKKI